jgi:hypothetical protein
MNTVRTLSLMFIKESPYVNTEMVKLSIVF